MIEHSHILSSSTTQGPCWSPPFHCSNRFMFSSSLNFTMQSNHPSTCPASSLVTFCSIWFYYTEKNLPDTSAKPIVFKWVSGRFSFLTCLMNNLQKNMVFSSFQSIESPSPWFPHKKIQIPIHIYFRIMIL